MSEKLTVSAILGGELPPSPMTALSFSIHGMTLEVRSNSEVILGPIADFLAHFRSPPATGAPAHMQFHLLHQPLAKCRLRELVLSHGEMLFDMAQSRLSHAVTMGHHLRYYAWEDIYMADYGANGMLIIDLRDRVGVGVFPDPSSIPAYALAGFYFAIGLAEMIRSAGRLFMHAAALAEGDRGVLIPGFSGSGKTTLAVTLLRAGFKFLTDDRALVEKTDGRFRVLSFPEKINVTPKTISLFPELAAASDGFTDRGTVKKSFWAENAYPHSLIDTCSPAVLLLPQVVDRDHSRLVPISRVETVEAFLPHSVLALDRHIARRQFHMLFELVQQMDCYRIEFGQDFDRVPGLVREALEKGQ